MLALKYHSPCYPVCSAFTSITIVRWLKLISTTMYIKYNLKEITPLRKKELYKEITPLRKEDRKEDKRLQIWVDSNHHISDILTKCTERSSI